MLQPLGEHRGGMEVFLVKQVERCREKSKDYREERMDEYWELLYVFDWFISSNNQNCKAKKTLCVPLFVCAVGRGGQMYRSHQRHGPESQDGGGAGSEHAIMLIGQLNFRSLSNAHTFPFTSWCVFHEQISETFKYVCVCV